MRDSDELGFVNKNTFSGCDKVICKKLKYEKQYNKAQYRAVPHYFVDRNKLPGRHMLGNFARALTAFYGRVAVMRRFTSRALLLLLNFKRAFTLMFYLNTGASHKTFSLLELMPSPRTLVAAEVQSLKFLFFCSPTVRLSTRFEQNRCIHRRRYKNITID